MSKAKVLFFGILFSFTLTGRIVAALHALRITNLVTWIYKCQRRNAVFARVKKKDLLVVLFATFRLSCQAF